MSVILVPKIAPKPIQDRFDASESSPDSLKIDFGAPKTRPRRQEAAWGFQNGSQTDFRSLKGGFMTKRTHSALFLKDGRGQAS